MRPARSGPISALLGKFPQAELRAGIIYHWAQAKGISARSLCKATHCAPFLEGLSPDRIQMVGRQVARIAPTMSLKELERCLELLIDPQRRTHQGAVYTPQFVVDYLIRSALKFTKGASSAVPCVVDPACGCGGFIVRAAEMLHEQYNIPRRVLLENHVAGIDNDPWAIQHAWCMLELYLMSHGEDTNRLTLKMLQDDALLTPHKDIWSKLGFGAGLDIVVTNPPYVKFQNLPEAYRDKLRRRYERFARGTFSTALLFIVAGHRLLSDGGCLAMITQNNLYTSLAGREVRTYLQGKKLLRRIVDFNSLRIFGNASAYTCLLFVGKSGSEQFEFSTMKNQVNAESLKTATFSILEHSNLKAEKWRLAEPKHLANLELIERIGVPLGALTSIRVGFATLNDSVFSAIRRGNRCLAFSPGGRQRQIEMSVTRPAVKVAQISHQDDILKNNRRVLFPYQKQRGRFLPIPESEFRENYPRAYGHLLSNRALLEKRDRGRTKYPAWYAWGRTQAMEAPGPKLLTKTFDRGPHFYMDPTDQLFSNGYGLFPGEMSLFGQVSLHALQRILNSNIMFYYMQLTSFQIEGNYQCYQKNFIERFGIPLMDPRQERELLRLDDEEVDEYLVRLYGLRIGDVAEVMA